MPEPTANPPPTAPLADMEPLFVTVPPACNASPLLPEMEPVLVTTPLLASDMPKAEADETVPALEMFQVVPAPRRCRPLPNLSRSLSPCW